MAYNGRFREIAFLAPQYRANRDAHFANYCLAEYLTDFGA
jgi:hypothetical protein